MTQLHSLWRGHFLEGLYIAHSSLWDDWISQCAEKFMERYLIRGKYLLEHELNNGRTETARDLGRKLLDIDPLSEPLARLLIRTHLTRNEFVEAHRMTQAFRKRFESEMGRPAQIPDGSLDFPVQPTQNTTQNIADTLTNPLNETSSPTTHTTHTTHTLSIDDTPLPNTSTS